MKFRMIWVGSEDEPDRQPSASEGTAAGLIVAVVCDTSNGARRWSGGKSWGMAA